MLRPGGRFAVSGVVADAEMDEATREDMAQWTGCIAGTLTENEFRERLAASGFESIEVSETIASTNTQAPRSSGPASPWTEKRRYPTSR